MALNVRTAEYFYVRIEDSREKAYKLLAQLASDAVMTHTLQTRLERQKWLRDRRVEAYTSAIRFLIRISNKRSQTTAEGVTVLGQDVMKEWFDDISEAWLTSLLVYCSERERGKLTTATRALNAAAAEFITSGKALGPLIERARATCVIVAKSARNDIGSNVVGA